MQADLSTLEALLKRVEEATGPDRELDAEIMFDLFAVPFGQKDDGGPSGYLWPEDNPSWSFGMRFPGKDRAWFKSARAKNDGETLLIERDGAWVLMNQLRIPRLTASIDAALALVEELLPGKYWYVCAGRARVGEPLYGAQIVDRHPNGVSFDEPMGIAEHEHGATLAILSALLRAMIAGDHNGR